MRDHWNPFFRAMVGKIENMDLGSSRKEAIRATRKAVGDSTLLESEKEEILETLKELDNPGPHNKNRGT